MFYGEVIYATIAPLAILGVIVLAILALSGRSEPDVRGDRPYVLYLSLVSFIALFTLLFAVVDLATTAIHSVIDEEVACEFGTSSQECFADFGPSPGGEQRTRDAINSGAVALVAGGVLLFHRRRSKDLVADPGFPGSPGARTFAAYLYAVAFTAMAIVIVAAAIALPALVGAIAPGVTAVGSTTFERDRALTDLVPALVAAGGATVIYLTHWRAADRLRSGVEG